MTVLDLTNFESDAADGCEYVLTSPRSLQACAHLGVKPIELLKVKIGDILRENPQISIKAARQRLIECNGERNQKLKECRDRRSKIIGRGQKTNTTRRLRKQLSTPEHSAKSPKNEPTGLKKSISAPNVESPVHSTPLGKSLKSRSSAPGRLRLGQLPTKHGSNATIATGSTSARSRLSVDERLMQALKKRAVVDRAHTKQFREHSYKWKTEKIKMEKEKKNVQREVQARVARSRRKFLAKCAETKVKRIEVEKRNSIDQEEKVRANMKRVEIKAKQIELEKEAKRKVEQNKIAQKFIRQKQRLRENEEEKEYEYVNISINSDKKQTEAVAIRKTLAHDERLNIQRENRQERKQFLEGRKKLKEEKVELIKNVEVELENRLEQAEKNNKILVKQRLEAFKAMGDRERRKVIETKITKEIIETEKQEKKEQELIKSELIAEEARKVAAENKKRISEELKEANVLERLHAIQLLEKSKQDFEKERDELENDINKRIIKNEANKISEAKTKAIAVAKARHISAQREIVKHKMEDFTQKVLRAELLFKFDSLTK